MTLPLMVVVSHRWKVLFATLASDMRRRRTRARSPREPPRFRRTISFSPQSRRMILGVRASAPNSRREKRASLHARYLRLSGSSRVNTAVRLEITTKSSRSILRNERSLGAVPCIFVGRSPSTRCANMRTSSWSM